MAKTSLIRIRVDEDFRKEVDTLFADLGFDTPTAIRIFLKQAIKWRGLPFEVSQNDLPNPETLAAISEGEILVKDPNTKRYSSFSEVLEDIKNEL